jgi:hypothetical protein
LGRRWFRNVLGALNAVGHQLIQVTNHSYINVVSVCQLLRAVAVPGMPMRRAGNVLETLDNSRTLTIPGVFEQLPRHDQLQTHSPSRPRPLRQTRHYLIRRLGAEPLFPLELEGMIW